MIIIISDRLDLQIYHVMLEIDELGHDYGLLNASDFPTSSKITQRIDNHNIDTEFTLEDGRTITASSVKAVWYRKPELPKLHSSLAPQERDFAFSEARAGLRGLYQALSNAYWMSPIDNILAAGRKIAQLRIAVGLGFIIPPTIFTNDKDVAKAFFLEHNRKVIFKSSGEIPWLGTREGAWDIGGVVGELYTTLLDPETLEVGLDSLSACPVLLQRYVDKEVEIRVTIVGRTVFPVEIHSQANSEAMTDWRRYDAFNLEHRIHELPAEVVARCLHLMDVLELEYAALDLIRQSDGRYTFLEINPVGQYGWIEAMTGLQISREIAYKLCANATA